jgi:hypothetical protein
MSVPAALLTEDEASLSGSGYSTGSDDPMQVTTYSSNFSTQSFLRSGGNTFWLLSPYARQGTTGVAMFTIRAMGHSYTSRSFWFDALRPVISLTHSTTISSGSGTATDPWVIAE